MPTLASVASNVELVIFDCDGVLVDSEPLVNRIESECLRELGLTLTPAQTRARFKGLTTQQVSDSIAELLGHPPPAQWLHDWGLHTANGLLRELQAVPHVEPAIETLRARRTRGWHGGARLLRRREPGAVARGRRARGIR